MSGQTVKIGRRSVPILGGRGPRTSPSAIAATALTAVLLAVGLSGCAEGNSGAEVVQEVETPELYTAEDLKELSQGVSRYQKAKRAQRERTRPERLGIDWTQAKVGHQGYVCGPVRSTVVDGETVFVNLGRDYPDPQRVTVVGWNAASDLATYTVAEASRVCAQGVVVSYQGVRQIQMDHFDDRVSPVR